MKIEKWTRFKSLKNYFRCKRAAKKAREEALIWRCRGYCIRALLAKRMSDDYKRLAKEWMHMVIFGR